jgi:hypothetical protein
MPLFHALVLVTTLSLVGCDYLPFGFTPIGQIMEQSSSFEGREVKLRGRVINVNKIPILNISTYTLHDDTGEIVVVQPVEPPSIGDEVALRGRVESLLILAGQRYGYNNQRD